MTKKELQQIYYLSKEVEMWQNELLKLQCQSEIGSPEITGMPTGKGTTGDRVGNKAIKIADTKKIIEGKLAEIQIQRAKITEYIISIDDSLTRQIFKLRCLDLWSWAEISMELGGGNTYESVRKRFNRYINKNV